MIYRVNFVSRIGAAGIDLVNTFHVWADGDVWSVPDPSCAQVAAEVNTELQAAYRNMLGTNATLDRISVSTVTDPSDPSQVPSMADYALGLAGARTLADDDLPPGLCPRITWRTSSSARSFRGRSFLPPVETTTAMVDDQLSAANAYTTAIGVFGDKIVSANLASGSTWSSLWTDDWHGKFVVYSPTRHAQGLDPYYLDITSYTIRRNVYELRSRRK